ncbi:hypothetical protein [Parasediminibacterium sp. JCM 36343]|uniref:hypothetical protein n=1 Tax=Parasediminibacterium sp. JCM 36343 TaxID=3374279 RepID=UPI00397993B9
MDQIEAINYTEINNPKKISWFSIGLYFPIMLSTFAFSFYIENKMFAFRLISVIGAILFYVNILANFKKKYLYNRADILLKFYILILAFLICTSIKFNLKDLVSLFIYPFSSLAFTIAIVALNQRKDAFTQLMLIVRLVNNLYLVLFLIDYLVTTGQPFVTLRFSYFILFEFIFFPELSSSRKLYITFLYIFLMVMAKVFDERTMVIRCFAMGGLLIIFYNFQFFRVKFFKFLAVIAVIAICIGIAFYFNEIFGFVTNFISSKTVDTSDTRSFLLVEFFQDFKNKDWIAGRGYLGTYYSQFFQDYKGDGGDSSTRFTIEIGLFDILLKGGLLMLIPFVIIYLKALWRGFVNSSFNTIYFRLSLYLMVEFMLLAIENFPGFTVNYMLMWCAIGIILNKKNIDGNLNKTNS